MSEPYVEPPPHREQREDIPYGKVVLVGVISLIIFTVGTYWAVRIMRSERAIVEPDGPAALPFPREQSEVGIVNVAMFEHDTAAMDRLAEQRQRLDSYGWVDKQRGVVHIPVRRAMELYLKEVTQ